MGWTRPWGEGVLVFNGDGVSAEMMKSSRDKWCWWLGNKVNVCGATGLYTWKSKISCRIYFTTIKIKEWKRVFLCTNMKYIINISSYIKYIIIFQVYINITSEIYNLVKNKRSRIWWHHSHLLCKNRLDSEEKGICYIGADFSEAYGKTGNTSHSQGWSKNSRKVSGVKACRRGDYFSVNVVSYPLSLCNVNEQYKIHI